MSSSDLSASALKGFEHSETLGLLLLVGLMVIILFSLIGSWFFGEK